MLESEDLSKDVLNGVPRDLHKNAEEGAFEVKIEVHLRFHLFCTWSCLYW